MGLLLRVLDMGLLDNELPSEFIGPSHIRGAGVLGLPNGKVANCVWGA